MILLKHRNRTNKKIRTLLFPILPKNVNENKKELIRRFKSHKSISTCKKDETIYQLRQRQKFIKGNLPHHMN